MTQRSASHRARRFLKEERASITVEFLIFLPVMIWVLLIGYVYFDVYRAEYYLNRASLTIADMFSRERAAIDADYLDGTEGILNEMINTDASPDYRVTVIGYTEPGDSYFHVWSENRGWDGNHTLASVTALADDLPIMGDDDRIILLEFRTTYVPPFRMTLWPFRNTTLGEIDLASTTLIAPRYVSRLCYDTEPSNPLNGLLC